MPKKELKDRILDKIDPVASAYYRDVAKHQLFLKKADEIELFKKYKSAKEAIHTTILNEPACLAELIAIYDHKIRFNQSTAKLCQSYNNKKTGHNAHIAKHLRRTMKKLHSEPAEWLVKQLDLSDDTYADLEPLCKEDLTPHKQAIAEVETILVRSTLMAAKEIAHRYTGIFGIEIKDAIQEANLAILEAIAKYDPDYRTKNGKRVKFITYAYMTAEKKVRELIMNHSRLIHLPRYQLDRIFLVLEAAKLLEPEHQELTLITVLSNLIMSGRKGRLLQENETLSEEDVLASIEMLAYPLLLDQIVNSSGNRQSNTVGDLIPDSKPTPEEEAEERDKWNRFEAIMKEHLNEVELKVIQYRYLNGGKRLMTYDKVKESLRAIGFDISRARILDAESGALEKLKEIPEIAELFSTISDN